MPLHRLTRAVRATSLTLPLLLLTNARSEKLTYHVPIQGSTQLSCKVTHKATKAEPYLLVTCVYRCDRPVRDVTIDAKTHRDTIYCRSAEGQTPAAQGQSLETGDDQ